jgi:redox-sensitive bicupin YhaK (pirin superfamily)
MLTIRQANERGHFNHGWLDTYHTFSFDQYYDRRYMGFRSLRVINEDRVAPGRGFPMHGHQDMEILTYLLAGALAHEDSMGNGSIIRPGEVQRMTAGTGVRHSERNPSKTEPVHLLQIWILPDAEALQPEYEQKAFSEAERTHTLKLIASADGREGSVMIHQDVNLFASLLRTNDRLDHKMDSARYGWLQVARGALEINGEKASAGDGVIIVAETSLAIIATEASEFLLFDLA